MNRLLTILFQDTTAEMGATGICPGTYRCAWVSGYKEKSSRNDGGCLATLRHGLIYHTDTIHRGGAHVDPFAVGSWRSLGVNKKRLAFGKVYLLDWRRWGLTIDDFSTIGSLQWKWSYLHPLGLRLFRNSQQERNPWSAVDGFHHIYNRPGHDTCNFLSNIFNPEQAKHMSGMLLYGTLALWRCLMADTMVVEKRNGCLLNVDMAIVRASQANA